MTKLKISEIKPNPSNPRIIKDDKFKKLVQSLKDFPEMAEVREIVVNKDHVVLGGNMRLKAMAEAGWTEAPVKIVDWPEDKQREFIIKDNSSFGEWDWEMLANEWDTAQLEDWGIDLPVWEKVEEDDDNPYTGKIETPVYDVTGENTSLADLYDPSKTIEMIDTIKASDINEGDKQFLINAAHRHTVFNYAKIAEYYASADKNTQELMEKMALVIIDYDKAIEYGFIKLSEEIAKGFEDEQQE